MTVYMCAGAGGVGKTHQAMKLAVDTCIPFYQEPRKLDGDVGLVDYTADHALCVAEYRKFFEAVFTVSKGKDIVIDCSPLQSAAWCMLNEGRDTPNVRMFLGLQYLFDTSAGCSLRHMTSEETSDKPIAKIIEELVNARLKYLHF